MSQIRIKSGARPTRFVSDGLLFDDGTKLDADVVVFATGFVGNMKSTVQGLFGPQVAAQIDDFWGLDLEGEIKGAFKPSGRECGAPKPNVEVKTLYCVV